MNKLLVLMISLFSFLSISNEEFASNCNKYYDTYDIANHSVSGVYDLSVVTGQCDGKQCFGVYFMPESNVNYTLVIKSNGKVYKIEQDTSYIEAYKLKMEKDSKIVILDGNYEIVTEISLAHSVGATKGLNQGTNYTNLTNISNKVNKLAILYGVLFAVCLSCIVALIIIYKTHSGIFKKSSRTQEIVHVKDLIGGEEFSEYDPLENIKLEEYQSEVEESVEEKVEVVTLSKEELKTYLSDKGFILEYDALSEEEKNKIMLTLMRLKSEGKITEELYKKETVELWKK